jgi:hypothetical protein
MAVLKGAADSALALVLAVVLPVATYFVSQHRASVRPFDTWAAALVIASAVALAARRTRPVAVLAVVFGIVLAYLATGYPDGPIWLTLIIAFFTAVLYGHRLAGVAAVIAVFGLFLLIHPLLGRGPELSAAGLSWAQPRPFGSAGYEPPRPRGSGRRKRSGGQVRSGCGSPGSCTTRWVTTCR